MADSLRDRLLKNSTIKETSILTDSIIYQKGIEVPTPVPMVNVALSGKLDGGLSAGLTIMAGPSKHFKSAYMLLLAGSFLRQVGKDGIVLMYDSEFGTPESYIESFGLPPDQVVHSPITDIEQLKFDIMAQLETLKRTDKVMIIIDSIGNLASKKEVEDALAGKSVADMTRAKAIKSLFRMVTPHLTLKDIPMVVVNHTYKTQEMYSKDVVSGGTGIYYSADNIWIIGRQQDKDDKELKGYNFVIKIEKSRHVKEGSKIPINVTFDSGIRKWSGMLELAVEAKVLFKGKKGNRSAYYPVDQKTGEVDETTWHYEDAIINNGDFWKGIFTTTKFASWITDEYKLANSNIMNKEEMNDMYIPAYVEDEDEELEYSVED